jgi:hypothetical protein
MSISHSAYASQLACCHGMLVPALRPLYVGPHIVGIPRHKIKESPLEWTCVCNEDLSKPVSSALLLSCLIKRCLHTHADCPRLA